MSQPSANALRPGGHRIGTDRARQGSARHARAPRDLLRRRFACGSTSSARLIVVYTVLGLVGPYLMGVALDRFIADADVSGLARIALLMLAAFVANNLFQGVSSWLMADISQRALKRLRRELFEHLQTLPMGFFERNPAGELMSRLTNDIDAINQAVSQNVTSLLASVLSMVGILVAMFVLDRWLALASLLVVPIMLWFTRFVAGFTRKGFRSCRRTSGRSTA